MEENTTSSPPAASPVAPPQPPPPPPPSFVNPPVITPPGPKGAGKGTGWKVLAIILLLLLGVSVLYNMSGFMQSFAGGTSPSSHTQGPRLQEIVREDNSASAKIAIVEVDGIITSQPVDAAGFNMVDVIRAQLDRARKDDRVKAVILKVDSPGGEVLASDEIYREIQHFQKQTSKPVIASMGNLAASGGYYISAPCHWIVANELTITGSIGVIMQGYNYRGLMDKVGLRPEVYKSGRFKDMLSGSRNPEDITPQERAMVQALIDETYGRFKEVVREGRSWSAQQNQSAGRALAKDWEEMADGRVLSGKEALKNGFVDELGNFQDAVSRAKKLANITKADLVLYQQIHDFSDFLRMFGKTDVKTVKVDVGLDMPKIQSGRLYFLSPILVH